MRSTKKRRLAAAFLALLCLLLVRPRWSPSGHLITLDLSGQPQQVLIRGPIRPVPVVLFLHGGPGFGVQPLSGQLHGDLLDDVRVVYWDQRGTATACNTEGLTTARILRDAEQLIGWIRAAYEVDRIGLIGASWGSVLALKLAAAHPEWFWAVVGEGQVISVTRGEAEAIDFAIEQAGSDPEVSAALGALSPPLSPQETGLLRRHLARHGGIWGRPGPYLGAILPMVLRPEYTLRDRLRYPWCAARSAQALSGELQALELSGLDLSPDLPVYFFQGRQDHLAPPGVLTGFAAEHPHTRILWFEQTGHVPSLERPDLFSARFRRHVLPHARP